MAATLQQRLIITSRRSQTVTVEYREPGEWLVLHANGQVEAWDTASHALRSIERAAQRGNTTVTITTIEWRNVPEGWKPPSQGSR